MARDPWAKGLMRASDPPRWEAAQGVSGIGGMLKGAYVVISALIALATFVACWIYCVDAYGFMLGVGLGWLPSAIAAVAAFFLWPLAALVVLWVFSTGRA